MPRPTKRPEDRLSDQFNVRLATGDRARIEAQAAALGITPSEFMRRRSLGYRLPSPEDRLTSHAVAELNRLGVNLNQIARHMNAGRGAPPHLADLLSRIDSALDRLLDGPGDNGGGPVL